MLIHIKSEVFINPLLKILNFHTTYHKVVFILICLLQNDLRSKNHLHCNLRNYFSCHSISAGRGHIVRIHELKESQPQGSFGFVMHRSNLSMYTLNYFIFFFYVECFGLSQAPSSFPCGRSEVLQIFVNIHVLEMLLDAHMTYFILHFIKEALGIG